MVAEAKSFLLGRFVLPRYSISVAPTGGGFVHIAHPTWAAADLVPQPVYRRLPDGTQEQGVFMRMVDDCYAEFVFPSAEPLWSSFAPWFVGTFEEVNEQMARAQAGQFAYYAFATGTRRPSVGVNRGQLQVRCLCVYPVGRNKSAEEQEERFGVLLGFLSEAARHSGASISDVTDFPNLQQGLTAVGEGAGVLNEVAAMAFKLEFPETYKTSKRYELQV